MNAPREPDVPTPVGSDHLQPTGAPAYGSALPVTSALPAANALQLISERQAAVGRPHIVTNALVLVLWGSAYLIGFGVLALHPAAVEHPESGQVWRIVVFGICMAVGVVGSIVAGITQGRGVRGRSNRVGAMVGITWLASFAAAGSVFGVIGRADLSPQTTYQLTTGISVLLVGTLYMAIGAFSELPVVFAIGVWFLVIDVIGMSVGHPSYLWINALLGGGAMVVAGVGYLVVAGRSQRG